VSSIQPYAGVTEIAPEQPLAAAVRHCDSAEKAAAEGHWDTANAEVGAVHIALQVLLNGGAGRDLQHRELHLLTMLDGRIKRLHARAAAARETTAQTLCGMRKQRNAAAAYGRHG